MCPGTGHARGRRAVRTLGGKGVPWVSLVRAEQSTSHPHVGARISPRFADVSLCARAQVRWSESRADAPRARPIAPRRSRAFAIEVRPPGPNRVFSGFRDLVSSGASPSIQPRNSGIMFVVHAVEHLGEDDLRCRVGRLRRGRGSLSAVRSAASAIGRAQARTVSASTSGVGVPPHYRVTPSPTHSSSQERSSTSVRFQPAVAASTSGSESRRHQRTVDAANTLSGFSSRAAGTAARNTWRRTKTAIYAARTPMEPTTTPVDASLASRWGRASMGSLRAAGPEGGPR